MSQRSNRVGLACCVLLVAMLTLPTIQWATRFAPAGSLYGYTDAVPGPPISPAGAFFNKTLQPWAKEYFDVNLGFRPFLIRTFNEINYRLFRENIRKTLVTASEHGLHSHLSIDYLNHQVRNRVELERTYEREAQKLLAAQQLLKSRGKYFEVVIATSKTYVHPEELGGRYLVGGSDTVFSRAASFGDALKAAGVNVIDSGPELRKFARETGIETHAPSGLHWNFYAGCTIARRILADARERQFPAAPAIECGAPQLRLVRNNVDSDGLALLNIWSDGGLMKPSPYPSIVRVDERAWRPRILFIGDSFSHQISSALQQAGVYSSLVMSNYFAVREVDGPPPAAGQAAAASVRDQLIADAMSSDIVILEMVDYNSSRFGYGFADYLVGKAR